MSAELLTEYPITTEVRPVVMVRETAGKHSRWTPIAQHREIVPGWLKSRTDRRSAARWAARHYSRLAAFHIVRTPLYASRVALYSPVGLWKFVATTGNWVYDAESKPERSEKHENPTKYRAELASYRQARGVRALMVGTPFATSTGYLALAAGGSLKASVAAVAVAGFGAAGRPRDKKLMDVAVLPATAQRITHSLIAQALAATIVGINDPELVRPVVDPHRDGPGWTHIVDLPAGITAKKVMRKREELAGAIGRDPGMVWPKSVKGSASRLKIFVSDIDLTEAEQGTNPLLSIDTTDYFGRIPVATNEMGEVVYVRLVEMNGLVVAMTRGAKSTFLRAIGLGVGLDPTTRLRAYDPKGTEFDILEPLSEHCVQGSDEASIAEMLRGFYQLLQECEDRGTFLRSKGARKVTRELAQQYPAELSPIVVIIDEAHELYLNNPEARDLLTRIHAKNAALGITIINATQRGIGDLIPRSVTVNCRMRWCGMVQDQTEVDAVLGTGAWGQGFKANEIEPETGLGYLAGQGGGIQSMRVFNPNDAEIAAIAQKALTQRGGVVEKLDLTPDKTSLETSFDQAEDVDTTPVTEHPEAQLLNDILAVAWPATPEQLAENPLRAEAIQMPTLAKLLQASAGDYRNFNFQQLSKRLNNVGIFSQAARSVKIDGRYEYTLQGVHKKDIEYTLNQGRSNA